MPRLSRFIPGEDIEVVSQWNFGSVDTDALHLAAQERAGQEAQERAREEKARQEGYALGFAQGRAHALVEAEHKLRAYADNQGRETAQRFAALIEDAASQLAASQQVIAQGVLELACELARQVVRQELSINPNVLLPVIREALSMLAVESKSATVRLHPRDLDMLRDALETEFAGMALALLPDASVKPGSCLIAASGAVIDGTLETRWRRAVANLGLEAPWEP